MWNSYFDGKPADRAYVDLHGWRIWRGSYSTWNDLNTASRQPKSSFIEGHNLLDGRRPRDARTKYEIRDLDLGFMRNLPEFRHWKTFYGSCHIDSDIELLEAGVPLIELLKRGPVFFESEMKELKSHGRLRTVELDEAYKRRAQELERADYNRRNCRTASSKSHTGKGDFDIYVQKRGGDFSTSKPSKARTHNHRSAPDELLPTNYSSREQDDLISPRTIPKTAYPHHHPTNSTIHPSDSVRSKTHKLQELKEARQRTEKTIKELKNELERLEDKAVDQEMEEVDEECRLELEDEREARARESEKQCKGQQGTIYKQPEPRYVPCNYRTVRRSPVSTKARLFTGKFSDASSRSSSSSATDNEQLMRRRGVTGW